MMGKPLENLHLTLGIGLALAFALMAVFHAHGYQRVKPPLMEFADGLLAGTLPGADDPADAEVEGLEGVRPYAGVVGLAALLVGTLLVGLGLRTLGRS